MKEITNISRVMQHEFLIKNQKLNVRYLSQSIDTVLSFVAESNAITFFSSRVVKRFNYPRICAIPLWPPINTHLSLALSPHAEPASLPMLFGDFVRNYISNEKEAAVR